MTTTTRHDGGPTTVTTWGPSNTSLDLVFFSSGITAVAGLAYSGTEPVTSGARATRPGGHELPTDVAAAALVQGY